MHNEQYTSPLKQLVVYRNLLNDTIVQNSLTILNGQATTDVYYELSADLIVKAEELGLNGNIWRKYLAYLIAWDENIFSCTVEKNRGEIGAGLHKAVIHDLKLLQTILQCNELTAINEMALVRDFSPTKKDCRQTGSQLLDFLEASACSLPAEQFANTLLAHYVKYGCGKTAQFAAFRWDEQTGLEGIRHTDKISLQDIVGYEDQKQTLIENTEAFLDNKPANNVLLVGARGTGKSSSVKGLINQYFNAGLRLVEVHRNQLKHLHKIIDVLRGRSQKFIVFLDDLSFEGSETEYKHLKSVIDGGIEARPDNVVLYATSNRRHLIREEWSDRADSQDIHANDSVHEKISLSDRFGIILTYAAPDQEKYLHIIETLATQHEINLPKEELKKRALRWELLHSGRSGRVAQQFVTHIKGCS